jgi:putative oxygen-independent coproporphyrinogen III oxidase
LAEDWESGGFGVYVHWPFCAAKCPYCDFNSHVVQEVDHVRWERAFVREIRRAGSLLPGRAVTSVFFGGGTPSLMLPSTVAAVIDAIAEVWSLPADAEVTLEANPTSVESERFRAYRLAGVNRLSMGIQALNDRDLRALGRMHDVAEALVAFDVARGIFGRISFDLIYARQCQTIEAWERELRRALALAIDHLSLYQLTIEPDTRFGELAARNRLRGMPGTDLAAAMYEATQGICAEAGLPAYEVSNHAVPGAECRHNLVYWNYGDYVGVGPGAHGRLTINGERHSTTATRSPLPWLTASEDGADSFSDEPLGPGTQGTELLMMGLRLADGICIDRYEQLSRRRLDRALLMQIEADGLIETSAGRLRATPQGRLVLNAIVEALLP